MLPTVKIQEAQYLCLNRFSITFRIFRNITITAIFTEEIF